MQKKKYSQESRPSGLYRITFDFSMLYTKMPHEKLLYVLNEITDFAFKGGARHYVVFFIIQEHFGHGPKVKLEDFTLSKK